MDGGTFEIASSVPTYTLQKSQEKKKKGAEKIYEEMMAKKLLKLNDFTHPRSLETPGINVRVSY